VAQKVTESDDFAVDLATSVMYKHDDTNWKAVYHYWSKNVRIAHQLPPQSHQSGLANDRHAVHSSAVLTIMLML